METNKFYFSFLISFLFFSISNSKAQELRLTPAVSSGELIVKCSYPNFYNDAIKLSGIKALNVLSPTLSIYKITFDENKINYRELYGLLKEFPSVYYIQQNYILERRDTRPNDPLYTQQWFHEKIKSPVVWDYSKGGFSLDGDTLVIAIIDGGFSPNHLEVKNNIWINKNEISGDNIDNDGNGKIDDINGWNFDVETGVFSVDGHGTSVSGIVGAEGNNGKGVSGVTWRNSMMFLEVATVADIIAAYDYVYQMRTMYNTSGGTKGAFIVATTASLGISNAFPSSSPGYCDALALVGSLGILNACATTNNNVNINSTGDLPSLCSSEQMLVINATKEDDSRSSSGFSKTDVDLAAPGTNIHTISPNDGFSNFSGTSAATPIVGGAIALLFSAAPKKFISDYKQKPLETSKILKDIIMQSVDQLSDLKDKTVSGGRLNIGTAIKNLNDRYNGVVLGALKIDVKSSIPAKTDISFNVTVPALGNYDYIVSSAIGKIVKSGNINIGTLSSGTLEIDISTLIPGAYYFCIYNGKNKTSKGFIKI